jgi:CheY-like chemotaxis protein
MTDRNLVLLAVDDSDDDLELLRLSFRRAAPSCVVTVARSTEEATRRLTNDTRPDLVLLDWKMPGMRGPEFIAAIRRDARTVGLPVLVFSSSDDPVDQREAFEAGATGWVIKPPGLPEYEELARDVCAFWKHSARRPP